MNTHTSCSGESCSSSQECQPPQRPQSRTLDDSLSCQAVSCELGQISPEDRDQILGAPDFGRSIPIHPQNCEQDAERILKDRLVQEILRRFR